MACNSLIALPRSCAEGVLGGLEKAYLIAFKDLEPISSGTTSVYSATTEGVVSQVGVASGKSFVEVGLLKNTAGLTEKLTKDPTKGVSFMTQTFTLVLSDLSIENQTFVKSVKDQPVAAMIKSRTGKYFIIGLNGQMEVTAIDGGTGVAEADLIGYTLTFEGNSPSVAMLIDDSLVASLIA